VACFGLGCLACGLAGPAGRAARGGAAQRTKTLASSAFFRLPRGAALTAGSPRAQAKAREIVYFKSTPFADGKAGKAGACSAARLC